MRFSSSLIAFVYLGFAAAAALPKPTESAPTVLLTSLPSEPSAKGGLGGSTDGLTGSGGSGKKGGLLGGRLIPGILRRDGEHGPSFPVPSVPSVTGTGSEGKGSKKGGHVRRDDSVGKFPAESAPSLPVPTTPPVTGTDGKGSKKGGHVRRDGSAAGVESGHIPSLPVPSAPSVTGTGAQGKGSKKGGQVRRDGSGAGAGSVPSNTHISGFPIPSFPTGVPGPSPSKRA